MNNTLKRLLSLFMAVAMVMSFAVLPAAAEDTDVPTETTQAPQETGHQHDLREEVTLAATCAAAGVKTISCGSDGCSFTEDVEIPATGAHSYENGFCTTEGCTAEDPNAQPTGETEAPTEETEAVCDGTENCAAQTHETTCECYDWCAALGCTWEVHHADCPWGPCTLTEGCELVKGHPGECTGMSTFAAVAKIGSTEYASLPTAVTEATSGDEIIIILDGNYTLPNFSKELTIKASDDTNVTINMSNAVTLSGAKVTFENLTFNYASGSTYKGIQHVDTVVYNNCTINGQAFLYGSSETFNNCTFNTEDKENYNVWTYGAREVVFNICTFNSAGKSVLVYRESSNVGATVNFIDCDLIASSPVTDKAAVEIDSSLLKDGAKFIVNIDADTTATGFAAGNISGQTLWNNKKGVMTEVKVGGELVYDGMNSVKHEDPVITTDIIGETAKEIVDNAGINADVDTGLSGVTTSDLESTVVNALSDKTITTPLNLETRLDIQLESIDDDTDVITFDIKPVVTAYNAATGAEVAEATIPNEDLPETGITFRLPVPSSIEGDYVTIVHKHGDKEDKYLRKIEGEAPNRYAELTVKSFSLFTMSAPNNYVAVVNGEGCATLKEAVEKVQAAQGEHTIELLKECNEDVTIVQTPGVKITIDGKNNKYTGTITVDGKSANYDTAALTIQNVNFDATNISAGIDASINLGAEGNSGTRYTNHVTVTGCTFTGNIADEKVAVKNYTGGCKNLTITGCTVTGMHSLLQVSGVDGLNISGCKITDSKNGISVGPSANATISDCEIASTGYGIRANGGSHVLNIEGVTITSGQPIIVRKITAGTFEMNLSGTNTLSATGGEHTIIFTSGDDGVANAAPTSGGFAITGAANQKVFPGTYEANVGATQCYTLEDALNYAAKHGGTVTLVEDTLTKDAVISIPETTGGGFTIDLTGKTLTLPRLYMDKASNVTITGGTIIGSGSDNTYDAIKTANSAAVLTLNGVTVQDSDRHVVRIEAGNATLNNCTVQYIGKENGGTRHLIHVGDNTTVGSIEINGGSYVHTSNTIDSGCAVNLYPNSTATITDGNFANSRGDAVGFMLGGSAASYSITGGTYKYDVTDYCADGYYCYKNENNQYQVDEIKLTANFFWKGADGAAKGYYNTMDAAIMVKFPEGYTMKSGDNVTIDKDGETYFTLNADGDNLIGADRLNFTFTNRNAINSVYGNKAPVAGTYTVVLTNKPSDSAVSTEIATTTVTIEGTHPAAGITVNSFDAEKKTLTLNLPSELRGDYTFAITGAGSYNSGVTKYSTGTIQNPDFAEGNGELKWIVAPSNDLILESGKATLKNFEPTTAGEYTLTFSYLKGPDTAHIAGATIATAKFELASVTHGTDTELVLKDTEYTLPVAAQAEGKTFKAWKVTIGTESKEYGAEAKFTVTGNATIEAVWEVAASIGDTTYDTLASALGAVQPGQTLAVGATAADGEYDIPAGVTVSVNGNTVKAVEGTMTMKLDNGKATFTIPAAKDAYLGQAYVNGEFIYITKGKDDESVTVTVNKRGAQNTKGTLDYSGTRIDSDDSGRPVYEITDIDGSATLSNVHIYGSSATMTFKCDGPYELFIGAHITDANGKVVWDIEDGNCAVAPGSTILTLYNDVLKKLPVGAYTMHMFYKHDNVAVVATNNFFVNPVTPTYVADPTNPKTGDAILLPMAVMFTSAAALFVLLMNKKKRA